MRHERRADALASIAGKHDEIFERRREAALGRADAVDQARHPDHLAGVARDMDAAYGIVRQDFLERARLLGVVGDELGFLGEQHAEQRDKLRQVFARCGAELDTHTLKRKWITSPSRTM